jgi:hypothetical protein
LSRKPSVTGSIGSSNNRSSNRSTTIPLQAVPRYSKPTTASGCSNSFGTHRPSSATNNRHGPRSFWSITSRMSTASSTVADTLASS